MDSEAIAVPGTTTAEGSREPLHIRTKLPLRQRILRDGLYAALARAATDGAAATDRPLRILDVGCGRGELLQVVAETGHQPCGIDPEPQCVELSSQYGECVQGSLEDLPRLYTPGEFDVIVLSHVLEHLPNPLESLTLLRKMDARRYVVAVPNVVRSARIVWALLGSPRGDHPAHLYGWGRAEFRTILRAASLQAVGWYSDRVTVNPLGGRFGDLLSRLLAPVEVNLTPRLFPILSSSLIAACEPI